MSKNYKTHKISIKELFNSRIEETVERISDILESRINVEINLEGLTLSASEVMGVFASFRRSMSISVLLPNKSINSSASA